MILETERLILRPFTENDAAGMRREGFYLEFIFL